MSWNPPPNDAIETPGHDEDGDSAKIIHSSSAYLPDKSFDEEDNDQSFCEYQKIGFAHLRRSLLTKYLHLVEYNAERIHAKLPGKVAVEDLMSAGIFGLMDAFESFDPNMGVKFETYCAPRIRGAILDELRSMNGVPRREPIAVPSPVPVQSTNDAAATLRYRLEDMVISSFNEMAFNAGCQFVDHPGKSYSPLFVHGGCGLGKTHLLQGLCGRYLAANPKACWRYVSAEQFTNEYIKAVRTNKLVSFRQQLRRLNLLVVDDIHFIANKPGAQTEFLRTFDAIDLHGAKIILASDANPTQIKELSEALVSRFMWGMVVRIHEPNQAERMHIIKSLAKRRGMKLLDSEIATLAERCRGSVRELEGVLTKLGAMSSPPRDMSELDKPIDHALVNHVQKQDMKDLQFQGLSRAEKLILVLYYYEEMTMQEIGQALHLSESRVSQMHSAILSRLMRQIQDKTDHVVVSANEVQYTAQADRSTSRNDMALLELVSTTELSAKSLSRKMAEATQRVDAITARADSLANRIEAYATHITEQIKSTSGV